MQTFTVQLVQRDGTPVSTRLKLTPLRYALAALGGPEAAEIAASGGDLASVSGWLGYSVRVLDTSGAPVWWGLVSEASFTEGGLEYRLSLDGMANRIAVIFTDPVTNTPARTEWAGDARSITAYGVKELLHSAGTCSAAQAVATRDRLLADRRQPQLVVRPAQGRSARLYCIGLWQTLAWRYYADETTRILHDADNAEAILGWGIPATEYLGFNDRAGRICQYFARLTALRKGDKVTVSGAAANNGIFTVKEAAQFDEQISLTAALTFDPSDDVHDSGENLDKFTAGEMVQIAGTANNDGFWFVKDVTPSHARVHPGLIVDEGSVTTTVTQGNSVVVAEAVNLERPDPGVKTMAILAHGVKAAQSFAVASGDWTAGEVVLWARRVGSTADSLKVELCADASGQPGTLLASALVSGTLVGEQMTQLLFVLPPTTVVSGTYWLVVSRTGAPDTQAYYFLAVDETQGYAGGELLLWDGAAWSVRDPAADLAFAVYGTQDTVRLAASIAQACGDRLTGVETRTESGIYARQYRDGAATALDEIERLLEAGDWVGGRLVASVTVEGRLIFSKVSSVPDPDVRWQDGKLANRFGKPLPKGQLPVGRWMELDGAMAAWGPLYLERCEYDVAGDAVTPEFGGASAWDVGKVRQG